VSLFYGVDTEDSTPSIKMGEENLRTSLERIGTVLYFYMPLAVSYRCRAFMLMKRRRVGYG
jgi:hypothetical protein